MDFFVNGEGNVQWEITPVENNNGVEIYRIYLKFANHETPKPITIAWKFSMRQIYSTWSALCARDRSVRQWFNPNTARSSFYFGAPTMSAVGFNGENALTVSLSDAKTPMELACCVNDIEEKGNMDFKIHLFSGDTEAMSHYETYLRIDSRRLPLSQTLEQVKLWWKQMLGTNCHVPAAAEDPLYSTWYNFHQQPKQDLLLKELEQAAQDGFKTVIIDDGWQFPGESVGDYRKCGDWSVSTDKFYDFKGFVQQIHQLGFKVMLWFPVPFVGYETEDYKKYADRLLYNYDEQRAGVLDVRYREVRQYIINTYLHFVDEYKLDGLKLDFVDSFKMMPESPAYQAGMDCETVSDAVSTLLREIVTTMTATNPDFLFEFRQNYVGPEIIQYCNMLRVADCAYDSLTNRMGVADLRMLSADTAIHADMLLWDKSEPVENCAIQLLNILFSVPQISVLLTESTQEQHELLKHYLVYWQENKDVLLHGTFCVEDPEANYSLLSSENEQKKVAVLYSKNSYVLSDKQEDIFNATSQEVLYLDNSCGQSFTADVLDCCGNHLQSIELPCGVTKVIVPRGGQVQKKS